MPVTSLSTRHFLTGVGPTVTVPAPAGATGLVPTPNATTSTADAAPLRRVVVVPQKRRRTRTRENVALVVNGPIDVTPAGGPVAFDAVGPSSAGASSTPAAAKDSSAMSMSYSRAFSVGWVNSP